MKLKKRPSQPLTNAYSLTNQAYAETVHGQADISVEPPVDLKSSPLMYAEQRYQTETEHALIGHVRPMAKEPLAMAHSPPAIKEEHPQVVRGPQVVEESPATADDIVVAIMGPTGTGKSTFIRSASGTETYGVGHTLKPFTDQIHAIRFWDQERRRNVVLVDTPGFDTTFRSDLATLKMVSNWLKSSYSNEKLLSGILYFHRITDNRMAFIPLRNLPMFRELCGSDALAKVHLITTMWDEVDPEIGEKRLDELRADYWASMITQGALTARCRGDDSSPKKLIQQILGEIRTTQPPAEVRPGPSSPLANVANYPQTSQDRTWTDQAHRVAQASAQSPPSTDKQLPQMLCRPSQVAEGPPAMVKIGDLKPDDIVIAIMGPTGAGKSSFICCASGFETRGVGHTLRPVTNQLSAIRFWDQEMRRYVVLVDTPGSDITFNSDRVILNMISSWLNSSDNKKPLSGILYLHRITDNRMADAPLRNVGTFRKLCGREALAKVHLITTMWDEIDPESGEKRLDEIKTDHWNAMITQGARIACCRNDDDSPKKLIRQILDQEDARKALLLQEEMYELKKGPKGTSDVQQLISQMETLVEKQTELRRRIDKEKVVEGGDVLELRTEYDELWMQIDDKLRQMQELKRLSWPKYVRQLFSPSRQ